MNRDIVTEMVQQMGLTPQMADQLQNQQGGVPVMDGYGPRPGLPATPEEQMRLMEAAQNPQPLQQPQIPDYDMSESESESTASTESNVDLAKVGLNSPPNSFIDNIMYYLMDPLIVMVLFIILSLTQVSDLLKKILPSVINNNTYYLLGVKSLAMGSMFLGSKLVFN